MTKTEENTKTENEWIQNMLDKLIPYVTYRVNGDSLAAEDIVQELFKKFLKPGFMDMPEEEREELLFYNVYYAICDFYRKNKFHGLTKVNKRRTKLKEPQTPEYITFIEYDEYEDLKRMSTNDTFDKNQSIIQFKKIMQAVLKSNEGKNAYLYLHAWFYEAVMQIKERNSSEVSEFRIKNSLRSTYNADHPINNIVIQQRIRKVIYTIFEKFGIDPERLIGLGVLPKHHQSESEQSIVINYEEHKNDHRDTHSNLYTQSKLKTEFENIKNGIWVEAGEPGSLYFQAWFEVVVRENKLPISEHLLNKHLGSKYPENNLLNNPAPRRKIKQKVFSVLQGHGIDPAKLFVNRTQKYGGTK